MRSLWKRWKKIVKKITTIEANILLSVIFIAIIIPLSFFMKKSIAKELSSKISKGRKSYWLKKKRHKQDLGWAYKQ